MADIDPIERRCVRFAHALGAGQGDRIAMLRIARTLKRVGVTLTQDAPPPAASGDAAILEADEALGRMQTLVRRVLLDHDGMTDAQVRRLLCEAVDRSLQAIDVLRAERSRV
jgi:hypothetical protein